MSIGRKIFNFFDRLEDKVRINLSRRPLLYAVIGAIGIILIWKGVEDVANQIGLTGIFAFTAGLIIMLSTGLLVSFFIGDSIIISGLKKEKKIADKTEGEVEREEGEMKRVEVELSHIERELEQLKKHPE